MAYGTLYVTIINSNLNHCARSHNIISLYPLSVPSAAYGMSVMYRTMLFTLLVALQHAPVEGFAPPTPRTPMKYVTKPTINTNALLNSQHVKAVSHGPTTLYMSDEKEGPGLVTAAFISVCLLFFVVSAFAPLLDFMSIAPSATDLSLGDAVVTRQDGKKLQSYQSSFDALSQTKIQQKLSNLPVFYLSNDGSLGDKIYLSYKDAESAAKGSSVKVTTLDNVMYPLVLKKGSIPKNAPIEIKNANTDGSYTLVPSAAALSDNKDTALKDGDIPLFVVEKLAFAGNDGRPEVPLFTEKEDGIISYKRLGKQDEPSIRTTSLQDVLESMEKGTRPAVGQLVFYGNADDVLKADGMLSQ